MLPDVSYPPKEEAKISKSKIITDSVVDENIELEIKFVNSVGKYHRLNVIDMSKHSY